MKIKFILYTLLFLISFFAIDVSAQTAGDGKKSIIFEVPEGFMPAPSTGDKKGMIFLHPDKPSGMFVFYTPDNQKSEDFLSELKTMFASMFIHTEQGKSEADNLKWSESALPAHKDAEGETGKIFTTSSGQNEVQVLAYVRTISEGQDVVYGYFARKINTSKKNSADFADTSGNGIKAFDKFWKTITVSNK